jgi:hypothetical protein
MREWTRVDNGSCPPGLVATHSKVLHTGERQLTSFLFWNLGRKLVADHLRRLVQTQTVDALLVAECPLTPNQMLRALNEAAPPDYHYAPGNCDAIQVFTRFPGEYLTPVYESGRFTMRHLTVPGLVAILLVVVHLPSKLGWRDTSQAAESKELASAIREVEKRLGHTRTAVVGDFNFNPFEAAAVDANALHAVMCRDIAARGTRVVQGREFPFFYNPMWSRYGDASPGPAGTYYYAPAEHTVFFWNMFDQLLLRPSLLSRFSDDDLQIVESDGTASLLSPAGTPDVRVASDHLPILFRLAL